MSGMKWGMKYSRVIVSLAVLILLISTVSAVSLKDNINNLKDKFSLTKHAVLEEKGKPSLASGQECGPVPTDGCVVTQNTTFVQGVFDLPNGITINASDIFLDCNNALIEGQPTPQYNYAIRVEGYHDVTVKNCDILNYNYPFYLRNVYGVTLVNNNFSGRGSGGPAIRGYNVTSSVFLINTLSRDRPDGFYFAGNFSYNKVLNNTIYGFSETENQMGGGNLYQFNNFAGVGVIKIYGDEDVFQNNNVSIGFSSNGKVSHITNNTFYSATRVNGTGTHFYDNQIYGFIDNKVYEHVYYCYDGRENTYYSQQGPDCSSDYLPNITSLEATYITPFTARVNWNTEIHATSRLSYGPSPGNFTFQSFSEDYVKSHIIDLRNLTPRTTYYYQSESCTILNCTESEIANFTTLASPYCDDGTPVGQCSQTRPLYCEEGVLIPKCQQCGCPTDAVCPQDGGWGGSCLKINYGYEYLPPKERNISFDGTGFVEAWGVGNITAKGTTFGVEDGRVVVNGQGTLTILGNVSRMVMGGFENETIVPGGYQYTGDGAAFIQGENLTVTMSGTIDKFYAKGIGTVTLKGDGDYRKGKY